MKHHLFIALGLLFFAIFLWRGVDALAEPGFGLRELYVLGGLVISGFLVRSGVVEWRRKRQGD